ncbi:hypothetical protein GCM10027051_06480 [Niabella terrae]
MNDFIKEDLQHIRKMMEQSSRFISLSGLSGIVAGIIALLGAGLVYALISREGVDYFDGRRDQYSSELVLQLVIVAILVLIGAIGAGLVFTIRKSRRQGLKVWTKTSRQVVLALAVPLIVGGLACLAVLYNGFMGIIAPLMLVFYGLALINTAKYTYSDIQQLGYCEAFLGITGLFFPGYGLVLWAIGFGILHIVYGFIMYKKYE